MLHCNHCISIVLSVYSLDTAVYEETLLLSIVYNVQLLITCLYVCINGN